MSELNGGGTQYFDPTNNYPLVEQNGYYINNVTNSTFMLSGKKLVELRDPISRNVLTPMEGNKYYSEVSGNTFSFVPAKEGEDPAFYPDFLPYDGMFDVKAKIENGRLVGENGISFEVSNSLIKLPIKQGLKTQEEIDANIALMDRFNEVNLTNQDIITKNKFLQKDYESDIEIRGIERKAILDMVEITGLPLGEVVADWVKNNPNLDNEYIVLEPEVEGRTLTIDDYLPNPSEPEYYKTIEMDPDLQAEVDAVFEHNRRYDENAYELAKLKLDTMMKKNRTRFEANSKMAELKSPSQARERAQIEFDSEVEITDSYRKFITKSMETMGYSLEEAISIYGKELSDNGVTVNMTPQEKEDGSSLTIEDYLPSPTLHEVIEPKSISDNAVGKVAKSPIVRGLRQSAKSIVHTLTHQKSLDKNASKNNDIEEVSK